MEYREHEWKLRIVVLIGVAVETFDHGDGVGSTLLVCMLAWERERGTRGLS